MGQDLAAERTHEVEAKSTSFRKELGLADLALTQILYVVGSAWVGTAAKLGTTHLAFWLMAIVLFYLPQAAVVIYLNRLMPIEGGLYQWMRVGAGEFLGFLTAWNIWAFTIIVMATISLITSNNIAYLLGGAEAPLAKLWWYTPLSSSLIILGITMISVLGLRIGKWLQDVGAVAHLLTFGALIAVPYFAMHRGMLSAYHPLAATLPKFTPLSLNIFGKMALGALAGFEYVAILAGECHNPSRSIGRSVLIAVPVIATMFILGTSSVLALVPGDKIDLVSPIPQTLSIGFSGAAIAQFIVPALILLLLLRQIGNLTLIFAGSTRLPMVAGWDRLLPEWFSKLHPRFRTPLYSIIFVSAVTLVMCLAGQIGVGVQEAFQLLDNAAGILYAFTYIGMFAIPLFAARRLSVRPPLWLKAACVSGLCVSVLYSVLSVFPIIEVARWQTFTLKIILTLLGAEAIGLLIFMAGKRKRQAA